MRDDSSAKRVKQFLLLLLLLLLSKTRGIERCSATSLNNEENLGWHVIGAPFVVISAALTDTCRLGVAGFVLTANGAHTVSLIDVWQSII